MGIYDETSIAKLIVKNLYHGPLLATEAEELQTWIDGHPARQDFMDDLNSRDIKREAFQNLLERDPEAIERKLLAKLGWDELPLPDPQGPNM